MNRKYLSGAILGLACVCWQPSLAKAYPVASVGSSISKAILKYFGQEGGEQAAEYLSKKGGQEIMERVTTNAAKHGDEAVEQVAKLTGDYGPEALAALDNAPNVLPVLNAIDDLPATEVNAALTRLAAGAPGRELAEGIGKFGTVALQSELKHPGVGLSLVRNLGDEGAELAARLSTDQAIAVGRHAADIGKLPLAQRNGVLAMLRNDTERVIAFFGRFVEANPGKTLFTVATTTVVLAEPERILGGDEIIFDADGNPIVVRKPGIAGSTINAGGAAAEHVSERYIRPVYLAIMVFFGTFVALWMAIKLWHTHRREQAKTKLLSEAQEKAAP
jgi:hypothetical protein